MKLILALALLTASFVFAGEIQHSARSVTNGTHVTTRETFTRNGSTNLFRETDLRDGLIGARVHRVYCGGQLAASILWMTDGYTVLVETGLTFQVNTTFRPDGNLGSVMLLTEGGDVLDLFNATNGLLYPAQDSEIKKANECSQLARGFISILPKPVEKK